MDSKQIIALFMPPLLLAVMVPSFQLLARRFGTADPKLTFRTLRTE